MSGPVCAVCGMGGYWVAYDPTTKEQRCVNHIGSTPESLRYAAKLAQESDEPHSCESCPTCGVHDGRHDKCCGYYDGVCCQEPDDSSSGGVL